MYYERQYSVIEMRENPMQMENDPLFTNKCTRFLLLHTGNCNLLNHHVVICFLYNITYGDTSNGNNLVGET